MLGTIQFGILLAGMVLFLPMGMAGWHLSRNKMLFFSCALFITLAIGVHVTPYIPSFSLFLSSLFPLHSPPLSCLSLLHHIVWNRATWAWNPSDSVASCGFQRLSRLDSVDLLSGSWIVVAGDSQARLFLLSLLKLVLDSSELGDVERDLFKRHSDYRILDQEHGLKFDFIWAPYESNLTDLMAGFRERKQCPDVVVMGSGLWHMLHVNEPSDYGRKLADLRISALSLSSLSLRPTRMFWLGMPTLVNALLSTEEKREKMRQTAWEEYVREMNESQLLREKGGPFLLLDVGSLTKNCGEKCAEDGMHYDEAVYDAAVHVMLNALLVVSHQRV